MNQVDVLIYAKGGFDLGFGQELAQQLTDLDGVGKVRFNPDRPGVLQVFYDPTKLASVDLLAQARTGAACDSLRLIGA
ncbi:hypothetical protein [Magnetospira sp. QH-2]|uniref:hypothetical protein n=1 Tax=Magnetospira sp. (strain QH-2) TaxID=1288970 RepID=UPI0003E80BBB|nr:hypothetical protein [Magnetospira sp. QH-2]CCQ72356.1 protein of unknown function [Magnetospira sp. QH-2]